MRDSSVLVHAERLTKVYARGDERVSALDGVTLDIRKGEFAAFTGPSGSGKTTLVNLLGCLDNPTSGRLTIDGREIFGRGRPLSERRLTAIRRDMFGYIFQNFYLIPTLTVRENVALPFLFFKRGQSGDVERILSVLGLGHRLHHLPGQLSGGEMQRVAIARALVNRPKILLADEPTGNLDTKRTREIGDVLIKLNRSEGLTVVLVTHNPALAKLADRVIELRDGRLAGVRSSKKTEYGHRSAVHGSRAD